MDVEPGFGLGVERLIADHLHAGIVELALERRPDFVLGW